MGHDAPGDPVHSESADIGIVADQNGYWGVLGGKRVSLSDVVEYARSLKRLSGERDELLTLKNGQILSMAHQIGELREYVQATEHWKIEPHDQKERAAWIRRLGPNVPVPAPAAQPYRPGPCKPCGGTGEIGLVDDNVPCLECGGSGDPAKPGLFKRS